MSHFMSGNRQRFETSLEINNISPIGQKISISPINYNQKEGGIIGNIDERLYEKLPEEIQLEQEIQALNRSYKTQINEKSAFKDNQSIMNVSQSKGISKNHNTSQSSSL